MFASCVHLCCFGAGEIVNKASEYLRRRRHVNKLRAVDYLGGECQICGYHKCLDALQFHHRNPQHKKNGRQGFTANRTWQEIQKDLDNCLLVCANCHFEIESAKRSLGPDYSRGHDRSFYGS